MRFLARKYTLYFHFLAIKLLYTLYGNNQEQVIDKCGTFVGLK